MNITFLRVGALVAFAGLATACSKEDPRGGANVTLAASSSYGSTNARTTGAWLTLTDFKVNLKEIKFKFADKDPQASTKKVVEDVKLKGPFELDLLSVDTTVSQVLNTVTLPNGTYREVQIKSHKSTVNGPMLGKTVFIKGTIAGTPFEFWHDFEENFAITLPDSTQDIAISESDLRLSLQFDLNFLANSLSGLDLSTAQDGDKDGLIEINPKDQDGNIELARQIKDTFKKATKVLKK